jgi:hypothetical protein
MLKVSEIKEDFMESDIPFRVDVHDYNAMPENFREIIDKGNEVIYSRIVKKSDQ